MKEKYLDTLREMTDSKEINKELNDLWEKIKNDDDYKKEVKSLNKYFDDGFECNDKKNGIMQLKFSSDKIEDLKKLQSANPDGDFAKLLWAMAWKNGDIGKEKSILDGFKENDVAQDVFPQFGSFLYTQNKAIKANSPDPDYSAVEPIMDRNTLRAYCVIMNDTESAGKISSSIPDDVKKEYWEEYRTWYKGIVSKSSKEQSRQTFFLLDHIMFVLGKKLRAK